MRLWRHGLTFPDTMIKDRWVNKFITQIKYQRVDSQTPYRRYKRDMNTSKEQLARCCRRLIAEPNEVWERSQSLTAWWTTWTKTYLIEQSASELITSMRRQQLQRLIKEMPRRCSERLWARPIASQTSILLVGSRQLCLITIIVMIDLGKDTSKHNNSWIDNGNIKYYRWLYWNLKWEYIS